MLLPKKSKKSKKEQNFYCVCCDFSTSKKSNYDRHLTTQKHLKKSLPIIPKSLPKKSKKEPKSVKIFVCEYCNKEYKNALAHRKHEIFCKCVNDARNYNDLCVNNQEIYLCLKSLLNKYISL